MSLSLAAENMKQLSEIIRDNENVAQTALTRKDYVQAFLLIHSLVESLLRSVYRAQKKDVTFASLIKRHEDYLEKRGFNETIFVEELTEFNRRRNRIIHNLWKEGYSETNFKCQEAATGAIILYGLLIDYFLAIRPEISEHGFELNEGEY